MKSLKTIIIIAVVIGSLILIKIFFLSPKSDKPHQGGSKPQALAVPVTGFVVKSESLSQQIYVSGTVVPYNEISLRSESSGKIIGIYFKDGQYVNKGKLLVKINDADLQAQLLKNKSLVRLAEQRLGRLNKLRAVEGVSAEEVEVLENEIHTLEADRAFILAQIAKTTIVAPFSGTVGMREISEGAFVNNNDVIASLVQMKPLYVDFSLPEKYVSAVKTGLQITFSTEGVGGQQHNYKAQITAIEPRVDAVTKTIRCRATYQGTQPLMAGSFVKVYVQMGNLKNVVMVPTQSVVPILKGQKVFIARKGVAQEVKVNTGIRTEDKIQILDSVKVGDTVITTGLLGIKNGSKLKLTKLQ
ncbi:MAG TPA: efflux RND transporter periplasmic adaptor subunit [Cytophagales bacterium]|nr:efflux RND transporter periplasmic adaptor subunit [Cytophagales bacterium]